MKNKIIPYFKVLRSAIISIYIPMGIFLVFVILLRYLGDIPFIKLTRDPISIAALNPLYGIVSNIGILIWCSAAAICLFSASIFKRQNDTEHANFFTYAGLFTLVLTLDDFFVIHESLRDYFGIPELVSYSIELILFGVFIILFRKIIVNMEFMLLLLAMGFLGASLLTDLVQKLIQYSIPGYYLLEDGLKLLGIASWAGYFAYTSLELITNKLGSTDQKGI